MNIHSLFILMLMDISSMPFLLLLFLIYFWLEDNHFTMLRWFCPTIMWISHRRRQWQPTPVLLPGKSHGRRSLVGCSPWCRKESDMTEWLHFHFSLSCIGEVNGNPLHCSWLENSRDGEPGRLPSMGLHRVGHDWSNLAAAAAYIYYFLLEPPPPKTPSQSYPSK